MRRKILYYKKIKKYYRAVAFVTILALCIATAPWSVLTSSAVSPATNKPVFYTPSTQYQHFPYNGPITIQWYAPTNGTVDHYLFSWRELSHANDETGYLLHNREELNARSIEINPMTCSVNRVAVAAVMSDGTEKWTDITFLVGLYNVFKEDEVISLKIWSDFGTATKNAIYYATQTWNNAIGYEVINTYDFSNSYNKNEMVRDGVNAVVGISVGVSKYLMTTYTRMHTNPENAHVCVEVDININKSKPWANSSQSNKYDVQNSMTHEIGHAIGLSHIYESDTNSWTMYGKSDYGDTYKRSLTDSDKAMARAFHLRAKI